MAIYYPKKIRKLVQLLLKARNSKSNENFETKILYISPVNTFFWYKVFYVFYLIEGFNPKRSSVFFYTT